MGCQAYRLNVKYSIQYIFFFFTLLLRKYQTKIKQNKTTLKLTGTYPVDSSDSAMFMWRTCIQNPKDPETSISHMLHLSGAQ